LAFHSEREADHSPPSSAEVKEWVELYLHSPNTPSWCGAQREHKDNFTFTFLLYRDKFMAWCLVNFNGVIFCSLYMFNKHPPTHWAPVVKRAELVADHSPPSTGEVYNTWCLRTGRLGLESQTGSGSHPTPYPMDNVFVPRSKPYGA
jgi:hypothetical protein